jgi:hypothetical protein
MVPSGAEATIMREVSERGETDGAPSEPLSRTSDDPIVALLARFPLGRPFSAEEAADYAAAGERVPHADVVAAVRARA